MTALQIISIVSSLVGAAVLSTIFTLILRAYAHASVEQIASGVRDAELSAKSAKKSKEGKGNPKAIIRTVVFAVILALILPLFVVSIINRFAGSKPITSKTLMVVASGSMSKKNARNDYLFEGDLGGQFNKYDIIILNAVSSPDEIGLYDIVAYRNDEGNNIIHRIVRIIDDDGRAAYVMRGDANSANDIYHPGFEDIIGVYKGRRIALLGLFVLFLQSFPGIVTIVALMYCLFVVDNYMRKVEKAEKERLLTIGSAFEVEAEKPSGNAFSPMQGSEEADNRHEQTDFGSGHDKDNSPESEEQLQEQSSTEQNSPESGEATDEQSSSEQNSPESGEATDEQSSSEQNSLESRDETTEQGSLETKESQENNKDRSFANINFEQGEILYGKD